MASNYLIPRWLHDKLRVPQRLIWSLEYVFVAGLINLFNCLPLRAAARFAGTLFASAGPLTKRAVKVRNNLSVVLPNANPTEVDVLVRSSFRHIGVAMVELALLARIWRQRARRIEFSLKPGASSPSPERRTVFVTAHLGAWQLTPLIGPQYGVTMPVIYAPDDNPYIDRKLARLRRAFGGPLVSRDGGIKVLMRALDKGQSIGLTLDTRMDEGEMLPFFNEQAMTNTSPARLALRYDCDMVPVLAERLPRARYRVHIYPPIKPRDAEASHAAKARDMVIQANDYFETWIAQHPDQWLCLKRRWPRAVYRRVCA